MLKTLLFSLSLFSFNLFAEPLWYVQTAACVKENCVSTYRQTIKDLGYSSLVEHTQIKKENFNIFSHPTQNTKQALAFVADINADIRVQVTAKISEIADFVYIDLGFQPNQKQAQWLEEFANYQGKKYGLSFTTKLQIERKFSIKILSGPFHSQDDAQTALEKIKTVPDFSRAFMVSR